MSRLQTVSVENAAEARADPAHPYLDARALRANAYHRQARYLWSALLLNLGQLVLLAVVLVGLILLARRTQIRPYVVEVDRHGQALAFRYAEAITEPEHGILVHSLSLWLRNVRGVCLDPQVQRQRIYDAYAYSAGRAVEMLNDHLRRSSPFTRADTQTVTVEVLSLLRTADEDTFKLEWLETIYDRAGHPLEEQTWQALLTVAVEPPRLLEQIQTNPLGIRVVNYDWMRLATAPARAAGAPRRKP